MDIAYINERLEQSEALFMCDDKREFLYEDMDYVPVSALSSLIWTDEDTYSEAVFDITSSGDLSVTEPIAKLFMSFDPFGITVLPNRLKCMDGISTQKRYIIAINNELDVLDENKSVVEVRTTYYDSKKHGYDIPEEDKNPIVSVLVHTLYIDEDKLLSYPENRRNIFRVKETNKFFFSSDIYECLYNLALDGLACGLTAYKFSTNEEAPRR